MKENTLLRDEIKYIRDLSKSSYKKDSKCFICEATTELQFHHFYSMTQLWEKWKKNNDIEINTVDDILCFRESFKAEFPREIYEETVTLCKGCHMGKLHKIYGKSPSLATAEKQKRWCQKMRDKANAKRMEREAIK